MNSLGLGVVVSMRDAFSRNAQRIQSSMTALDQTVAVNDDIRPAVVRTDGRWKSSRGIGPLGNRLSVA